MELEISETQYAFCHVLCDNRCCGLALNQTRLCHLRHRTNRDKLGLAEFGLSMSESGLPMQTARARSARLSYLPRSVGAVQTKLVVGLALGVGLLGWLGWGLSRVFQQSVSVYWLTDANSDIHYVIEERTVSALSQDRAIAVGLNMLIDGHPQEHLLSAVPTDTELLGARQEGDEIYLDFSAEFASGGGASSLLGRVTQVLYTATSAAPTAKVWIAVEGEPVEVLSGEGLLVEQPLTRDSFPPNFKDYIASPQELQQGLGQEPDIVEPLRDPDGLEDSNGLGGNSGWPEPNSSLSGNTI